MTTGLETRSEQASDKVRLLNSNLLPNAQEYRDLFQKQNLGTNKSSDSIDFGNAPNIYGNENIKASGRDVKVQSAPQNIKIEETVGAGVSAGFRKGVEEWAHEKLPVNVQQIMHDHHIGITIYQNSSQLPKGIREMHARRHPGAETYANLQMFYDPTSHASIFIENPTPKSGVQTQQGAENTKSYQVGPNRETASHELGHALDYQFLNHLSASKEFDDAFRLDNGKLNRIQQEHLGYYYDADPNAPKGQEHAAAKEELLAQLYAALITPPNMRGTDSIRLMEAYPAVIAVMRKHMKQALPSE